MSIRIRRPGLVASLSLSLLAAGTIPAVADLHVVAQVSPLAPDEEFPGFLLAGQSIVVEVTVTDDARTIRPGQVAVFGTLEPDTVLAWRETAPGRFTSGPAQE